MKEPFQKATQAELTKAQSHYLSALQALVTLQEINCGYQLNQARDALMRESAKTHWTQLTDKDFKRIHPDLMLEKFNSLYGDYTPSSQARPTTTPWVRDRDLLAMIGAHIRAFGTKDDVNLFNTFLNNHQPLFQDARVFRVA